MAASILVLGEVVDGTLTKLSTEVATLARTLAEPSGSAVSGVVVAMDPAAPAAELARFTGGVVDAIAAPDLGDHVGPQQVATAIGELAGAADYLFLGGSPDGRDTAGILAAVLGRGVLANAIGVDWDDGPTVQKSAFGGKLLTRSTFTGGQGIVTVRPNAVEASAADSAGEVRQAEAPEPNLPMVKVVDRISEAGAAASLEDARVIVAGGRGIGGEDGLKLLTDLAESLGGVVGATRAAVDAGWIAYSQQIGQTGKIVKPQLYLAVGVSGAIQHKVGMQTAETIIAINRDPDAPIAEFADLMVVGDLFEVGPALLAELKTRKG